MGAAALQDTSVVWPHRAALLVQILGRRRHGIKICGQCPFPSSNTLDPSPAELRATTGSALLGDVQ